MMVDGAVVMVENGYRLLSHQGRGEAAADRNAVILRAATEVANPIAFAILIIIVVFLPLFSLTDLEGKLFKPMALTITFAMAGSLLLTLTLVPVLSALLLRAKEEKDTLVVRAAKRLYLPLLGVALAHKGTALSVALVVLAGTLSLFPFLGKEFMPTLQEGMIQLRVTSIPSTSLDESIAVSRQIDAALKTFPQVVSTVATIGRAEKGETSDVNYMEINVTLKPIEAWPQALSYPALAADMQEKVEQDVPTVVVAATQPIQSRVEELISGVRATLALKLYGPDLVTLDRLSGQIKTMLETIPGVVDLSLEANTGKPQIAIRAERSRLARYGLSVEELLEVVQAGIGSKAVSTLIDGTRSFDIVVWLPERYRKDIEAIQSIPLRTQDGAIVPLAQVADVEVDDGYSFVRREQLQRYAVIQMDVRGRAVDAFVKDAEAGLAAKVKLPAGYYVEWAGSFENQQRALTRLALIVPLTVGLIFILLYTAFNSVAHAALIIANVPFALVGGIVGLFASGQYLSVPSAVGFIAVLGVAMLNGIVLISFMNELRRQGRTVADAVREAAALRLRPVLMTASVAILGLIPMLLSRGVGAETQRPLATVVVGGLITSTLLTLLLLPLMYEWVEARRARQSVADQAGS
jgi:cobalt-zinc-cadmium resistance protein CzcA